MPELDTRREGLDPHSVAGPVRVDDSVKLVDETTGSTATDLNVNVSGPGVIVIAPRCQQINAIADLDCGAAIVDGESLPVAVVAYHNPAIDTIVVGTVQGTGHTTPAAEASSRAYYPTDAEIEAALPDQVEGGMYTLIGVVVFARSGATVTQHYDHTVRSYGLIPDQKLGSGDQF